jgi:hypothetical protein
MNILYEIPLEQQEYYQCEVVGCDNNGELYVEDFDGDSGYICKKCNDEDEL